MKTAVILISATLLSLSSTSGQTLKQLFSSQQKFRAVSPVAMVEMMERKLNDQFKNTAYPVARQTTAKMIRDGRVMSYGTVINGRNDAYSYLLCPADAVTASGFVIQTQDGKLHRPVDGLPVQQLSRSDNLAIVRIARIENVISIKNNSQKSSVGAFVGILAKSSQWKTGAVTNSARTAYQGIEPRTQRALSKHWERIGLKVNQKRSGYPEVIETDLNLDPAEAGCPVFDRAGTWHGIAIARADQHSTLVIPAKRIANMVAEFEIANHR